MQSASLKGSDVELDVLAAEIAEVSARLERLKSLRRTMLGLAVEAGEKAHPAPRLTWDKQYMNLRDRCRLKLMSLIAERGAITFQEAAKCLNWAQMKVLNMMKWNPALYTQKPSRLWVLTKPGEKYLVALRRKAGLTAPVLPTVTT